MSYTNPTDRDIVEWLPRSVPDRRIRYGNDPLQFGDIRLPGSDPPAGGHPVVIVLHGGGYSPNWNLDTMAPLAETLTIGTGVVTWNLEYRRPGQAGGGWPGTWLDIANGIDHLRALAERYHLNLDRVVTLGHSAGSTFAAWAAARGSIEAGNALFLPDPVVLRGTLLLAGILDLDRKMKDGDEPPRHLKGLLAVPGPDDPESLHRRLASVSPIDLVRQISVPQHLIVGSHDAPVMVDQTRRYVAARKAAAPAEEVDVRYLDGANLFDLIDSAGAAWQFVSGAVLLLLGLRPGESRQQRERGVP